MYKISIPEISNEELLKRYEQIKPLIRCDDKLYHLREFDLNELIGQSFIWDYTDDLRNPVGENEFLYMEGEDFLCLHRYGYYGLFKPSIAEVLSQIDDSVLPFVSAFELLDEPMTSSDFHKDNFTINAFHNGYHVSKIRLYQSDK